jgi:alkylation response protein AidB-like acyl-CoA dehydrogenase
MPCASCASASSLPHAARWDREAEVPRARGQPARPTGLPRHGDPEEWGGVGYDARTIVVVLEEIARVSAALAIMVAVHNSVGALADLSLRHRGAAQALPAALVSKELCAFSLSEPGAGSDVAALSTTAVRSGDHYVLNGSKNWVTNGAQAGTILLFARTKKEHGSKSLSAFILERGTPGLEIGKPEDKMGSGAPTRCRSRSRT